MYNFVIYTDGFNDLEDMLFKEVSSLENVFIISKNKIFKNSISQNIFKFYFSFRVNNIINLPFKEIWFSKLDHNFSNNNPTIYLFLTSWYYPKFFRYLRKKHPTCKLAFYFGDTVISKKRVIKNLDISYLQETMDYIGSYNPDDVLEYNMSYLPMCYSKITNKDDIPTKEKKDIIFIGASRRRMHLIMRCYEQVKKEELNYLFYVVTQENLELENEDKNFILTKKPMEYKDYLGYVTNCKCIVEIIDSETNGGTLRFWDAIMYNKKIVTNNKNVLSSKFFDEDHIKYTNDFLDLNFKKIIDDQIVNYNYKGENSPETFLAKISNSINGG
ncbi:hypothetical protein [Facklamia miroungae]|uniref:Uncharacterized protein n=1 Tax=Facklamia miroungae TaxID=120956 RepID=A0A1G7PKM9_9LACT|nr:hypothetical protein [Facklamia miroungae]NKZ28718.1 hypothetical protein [Facklamia miroungae]SDF85910.1 hypothetical protein SAMN05421791_101260 [Facklamia miroungae]